jgi:endonuclease I
MDCLIFFERKKPASQNAKVFFLLKKTKCLGRSYPQPTAKFKFLDTSSRLSLRLTLQNLSLFSSSVGVMVRFSCVLLFCFLGCAPGILSGQGFQLVYPGLSGSALIDSLSHHYRPGVVLDYANARDTLYKILASDDDSLRCIYSGHTLYLDPSQDPTQYVYQNGGTNGINAEHSFPQSKGATVGTFAHSDMHHLYPTRIPVNEVRGDKPFAEIPDQQTQKWYINNVVSTSIPTENIELYSESGSASFEPREAVKGDIARSLLYFYTVYQDQADNADPNFFNLQRSTLCVWNEQDPADSAELKKTWRIAAHQDGKPNPFVLDCTLATRSWCPEVTSSCLAATSDVVSFQSLQVRVAPQPISFESRVYLQLPFSGDLRARIFSVLGNELYVLDQKNVATGELIFSLENVPLEARRLGVSFLEVSLSGPSGQLRRTIALIM